MGNEESGRWKVEVGMFRFWNLDFGFRIEKARVKGHRVGQGIVLRLRVSGVRGRYQKTDDRGQKSEARGQKSEVRKQMTEVRSQRSENR